MEKLYKFGDASAVAVSNHLRVDGTRVQSVGLVQDASSPDIPSVGFVVYWANGEKYHVKITKL